MKISYNWLRQYIETDKTPAEVAALLTASGLEVESVEEFEQVKGSLQGMVIGEVLTCEKHPDADKLKVTTVDLGGPEPKQIVCGAANVAPGQKVVVAVEGATLYPAGCEPFKIKKSKIRGVASEGMICAEDEIGLGASHEGIMVLETDLPNGTPAAAFFKLEADSVLEIGLTPNRADAASHFGVARDLAVLLKTPAQLPDLSAFAGGKKKAAIQVEVQNPESCIRYSGISIEGVTVTPSPEWLQMRLRSIGLSPINNIVDITNFVLHELGQPLHAFDADKIEGQQLVIRNAEDGESIITLDNVSRKLLPNNLLIADARQPMVIAGVFGGLNAAVSGQTQNIFLESACFSPDSIRKTAQQHGLKTDSSFRFERGTDPEMVLTALKRAALLISEIAGGTIASGITDVYPTPVPAHRLTLNLSRLNRLIGVELEPETIAEILASLEIKADQTDKQNWVLEVPAYRVDVKREVDIAEEVLRIYGYNAVPLQPHMSATFLASFPKPDAEQQKERIADSLSAVGFNQIITNSLTNSTYHDGLTVLPVAERVPILNYNSEELNQMRQTMVFSGLEVLQHNLNRRQRDLKLYEFGTTYHKLENGYDERNWLALFMTGNAQPESWQQPTLKTSFRELSAAVNRVLILLGLDGKVEQKPIQANGLISAGLSFILNGKEVGFAGALLPALAKRLDVKETVFYAELNWDAMSRKAKTTATISEISKFPEVRRDLSLVLDKQVTYAQIRDLAAKTERKLLRQTHVFDVYEGDKIEAGKKAYSISFILQDQQQTLTDKVIDAVMNKLIATLEKELGAVIRK